VEARLEETRAQHTESQAATEALLQEARARLTTSTVQDYIASLAGRYEELQDSHVVSGEGSRRFNNYVYSRKLLIRKSVDDSGMPSFFYYE